LVEALRMERDARVRERILAVRLAYDGFPLSMAARMVGRMRRTVLIGLGGSGKEVLKL
jgi:hypothetical protein